MIAREIGDTTVIGKGKDYSEPRVRVIPNTHPSCQDGDKAVYISQGRGKEATGISISVETLQAIIDWANTKE